MASESLAIAAATSDVLAVLGGRTEALTATERGRAEAFLREQDRLDFIAAHLLVRLCAAEVTGADPWRLTLIQQCPSCGKAHGKPRIAQLPEITVSMSHTREYVAAAAGQEPVGIDAERLLAHHDDLVDATLTPAERAAVRAARTPSAFVRQWVRKEALIKLGYMTLDQLAEVDLSALPLTEPAAGTGRALTWGELRFVEWSDPRVVAAVAGRQTAALRTLTPDGSLRPVPVDSDVATS